MLKRNIVIILFKALVDDVKDIVMKSQLFRIQDLDFPSFYDVSTQLFLVHNVVHGRPANTKYRAFFYSAHKLSWDCVYSLFAGKPVAV